MAFQIKDFASIAASMVNWVKSTTTKITDFNQGSVARTLMEAPAAEIEELYLQMVLGLKEAIPVSVYNSFEFDRLAATAASGAVRFSVASPAVAQIPIPIGTAVRQPGKSITYSTQADAVIDIGDTYVDVIVACSVTGSQGNTGADTLTEMVVSVPGVNTVTNQSPLVNGHDVETDDERRTRFREYIRALARGTIWSVIYGAKQARLTDASGNITEYVASASLVEPWLTDTAQPVALVKLYVHNGGSATSPSLVAEAKKIVDGYYLADGTPVPGWKAAGVRVDVLAATDVPVNVTGTVTVQSGYLSSAVLANATSAVQAYIQGLPAGTKVLKSELVSIVKRDVAGVANVVLTAPASDVTITGAQKAISGTITLTT